MKRPSLTKRVVEGLDHVLPFLSVHLDAGEESELFEGKTDEEGDDIEVAIEYLSTLVAWYENK